VNLPVSGRPNIIKSLCQKCKITFDLLADRTNGRAYATVLRPSVVSDVVLWLNGASRAKVTIDSHKEVVYEESIGTKMNNLDLCLEVVSRSCQPLRYTVFDVEYLGDR